MSFPCGRQLSRFLYQGRTLLNHSDEVNITMETDSMLDDNSTGSWVPELNFTETEDWWNETEWRGEEEGGENVVKTRIVGGDLERQGGSPWQVWGHFVLKLIHFNVFKVAIMFILIIPL